MISFMIVLGLVLMKLFTIVIMTINDNVKDNDKVNDNGSGRGCRLLSIRFCSVAWNTPLTTN